MVDLERLAKEEKEQAKKMEECKNQGHPNAQKIESFTHSLKGGLVMTMLCSVCGVYERTPTIEEWKMYDRRWDFRVTN